VAAALEEYIARRRSGEELAREAWLARYPEIRETLSLCLGGLEALLTGAHGLDQPWQEGEPQAGLRPSTLLGDFRVLRELGRGGMGIVYEAEQVSLGRRVALKVLPPSSSIDPRWRQRFQVEAQAAANLRHDHIVPVFALGMERGVSYYAMPYIEGRTLAEAIHELRVAAGLETPEPDAPNSDLTPLVHFISTEVTRAPATGPIPRSGADGESRPVHLSRAYFRWIARLGAQAAEALSHAHELGIVHRDVKPSNLMVDHRGELWLTDFGLARLLDDDGLTRTGDLVGTLRYMSPEQAQARRSAVDHRTDIYSLGATLYELATLTPAFKGRDRQELLNKIALDEPTAPRRLNPTLPRDLETIIRKAMAKEVSARYAVARDLADDLKRFLDDRTISARPPSRIDRAAKFTRRHRISLLSATAVLVVALASSSVLLWLEQSRTQRALDEVSASYAREQDNISTVLMLADMLILEAIATHVPDGRVVTPKAQEYFLVALRGYESIANRCEHNSKLRTVAAEAFRRVAGLQLILRDDAKLEAFERADIDGLYQRALGLARAEARAEPRMIPAVRLLAAIEQDFGASQLRRGDVAGAIPHFRKALDALRGLFNSHPEQFGLAVELDQRRRAVVAMLNQHDEFQESTRLLREALSDAPGVIARNNLAWHIALHFRDEPDRVAEAVALARRSVEEQPRNAAFWNTLALALFRSGDLPAAEEAIRQSMAHHVPDASDFAVHALIQAGLGDHAAARAALKRAAAFSAGGDLQRLLNEARTALERTGTRLL
jgi:serine/threonine protein kinase